MYNWHGEDLDIRGGMCSIPKLINFMCGNVEVRDKPIGVKICRGLVITILWGALVLFRINF